MEMWEKVKELPAPNPKSFLGWLVSATLPRLICIILGLIGTAVVLSMFGSAGGD